MSAPKRSRPLQHFTRYQTEFKTNKGPETAARYLKFAQRSNDHRLLQEAASDVCDYLVLISTLPENFNV